MQRIKANTLWVLGIAQFAPAAFAAMSDHAATPPSIVESVDPNVMINMSIETPMGGAAYNDQPGTLEGGSVCSGRTSEGGGNVGICYFTSEEYLGYFDPDKCYDYDSSGGYFEPNGATDANHQCSSKFSGNMLNWATMTAIDEFRWAMTGGNRVVDTATETVIKRARKHSNDGWFPVKLLKSARNVDPSTVTPWGNASIFITNSDFTVTFGSTHKGNELATYNVRVKVCDSAQGLEDNCNLYGTSYKPEGLVQENASSMRFALMSYSADSSHDRHGGVLRANMKYVGPTQPASGGGTETNANAEYSATDGTYIANPDNVSLSSGVSNSGVINYINQFAESQGYKAYDPIGELFYECIRYFKNLGPTPEFYSGLTDSEKDGFPVLTSWDDPIQHSCQNNYIIGINDANPWEDKRLPGTAVTSSTTYYASGWRNDSDDWGEPSNADSDIDVTVLTNTVGDLQGITNTSQTVGCVPGDCDLSNTAKTISELGKAFGTAPGPSKQNSYYIAGLAYYARTNDLRSDANMSGDQTITTFMIDTQEYNANPLTGEMNMLWLAGKYGGFEEINDNDSNSDGNDKEPDLTSEWDADGDGEPDNYVRATNPQKLVDGLTKAFSDVEERVSAGTAAAVIANSATGVGALYQAVYEPSTVRGDNSTTWGGALHGLFIDDKGLFREDSNGNGQLDSYATDSVVELKFDETSDTTEVYRYTNTTDGDTGSVTATVHALDELKTIWDARDSLASLTNSTIGAQRSSYTTLASSGRHIFTWIDSDDDATVDNSETIDFVSANFTSGDNYRYLDVASSEAADIVDFIRGKEGISGFRSRTIDYDNDGADEAWRLGDIVHSSPVAVGKPGDGYDVTYGDSSYATFRDYYKDRRQMIYTGANDGMLHAFNGGFWDSSSEAFLTNNGTDSAHPLGSEVWAYVPMNLLPHLQWLKEQDYPHVYYVDGVPQAFDVNIFSDDSDHPGGWGTVLVVGMRLGGGPIGIDTDGDNTDDKTLRSAYVILDVTNPEKAPTLIAEVTHADMGYTTSKPALYKKRVPGTGNDWGNPSENKWHLLFGSGPDDLDTATSSKTAKLFVYDLEDQTFLSGYSMVDLAENTSFVGDIRIQDWDKDFIDDAGYFGIVGGTVASPTGKLKRWIYTTDARTDLIATNQPFLAAPEFSIDQNGRRWVFAGTGRLLVSDDNQSTAQQSFYGIKEPIDINDDPSWGTVLQSELADVTDIQVFDDGTISYANASPIEIPLGNTVSTFDDMKSAIDGQREGWYFDFDGSNPAARSLNPPVRISKLLLFTDYTPSDDECQPEGESYLYALDYTTGTPQPFAPLGIDMGVSGGVGNAAHLVNAKVSFGKGASSALILHRGAAAEPNEISVISQSSTGALQNQTVTLPPVTSGRQSWRIIDD